MLTDKSLTSNYGYWREHGSQWGDEYEARKHSQIYFHLQEIMLAAYVTQNKFSRLLEYGCGVGRHLSYLSRIDGVDAFGYDQSPSMVGNMRRWASEDWIRKHITVGEPVGRLPYTDGAFDFVFTCEVLIHCSPSDIESILLELIRVSKGHILHLEPRPGLAVSSSAHEGCWNHDLVAAYSRLGMSCEILDGGFDVQSPYRVLFGGSPKPSNWPPALLDRLRNTEKYVQPTLDRAAALSNEPPYLARERAVLSDMLRQNIDEVIKRMGVLVEGLGHVHDQRLTEFRDQIVDTLIRNNTNELLSRMGLLVEGLGHVQNTQLVAFRDEVLQRLDGTHIAQIGELAEKLRDAESEASRTRLERDDFASKAAQLERKLVLHEHLVQSRVKSARTQAEQARTALNKQTAYALSVTQQIEQLRLAAKEQDILIATLTADTMRLESQIAEIARSKGYRLAKAISKSFAGDIYRWAKQRTVAQQSPAQAEFKLAAIPLPVPSIASPNPMLPATSAEGSLAGDDVLWFPRCREMASLITVCHPDWRGIRSAASQRFDNIAFVPDYLSLHELARRVDVLLSTGATHFVFEGFPHGYADLARLIRKRKPKSFIAAIWHGTFVQAREDYAWTAYNAVMRLALEGTIDRLGVVKRGMERILQAQGIPSRLILNFHKGLPETASSPLDSGPHLGLWAIHDTAHKPPFEMLAACAVVPSARVHASGLSARAKEFAEHLMLSLDCRDTAVPHAEMPSKLAAMHVNLYVTFNECAPMLPLESFAVGAPCVIGSNSHYFEDSAFLTERVVCTMPDDASQIADKVLGVLEERDAVIDAYRTWAKDYNARAAASVAQFVDC